MLRNTDVPNRIEAFTLNVLRTHEHTGTQKSETLHRKLQITLFPGSHQICIRDYMKKWNIMKRN